MKRLAFVLVVGALLAFAPPASAAVGSGPTDHPAWPEAKALAAKLLELQ